MRAEELLASLSKVRRTAPGQWVACCPSHNDKSPSLSIRDADGRILIHCFSGCSVEEVVGAMGLSLSDLMPERLMEPSKRLPFNPMTVLNAIALSSTMVAICASDMAKGKRLSQGDQDSLMAASALIAKAMNYVGH